jgi:hypothetical protein
VNAITDSLLDALTTVFQPKDLEELEIANAAWEANPLEAIQKYGPISHWDPSQIPVLRLINHPRNPSKTKEPNTKHPI